MAFKAAFGGAVKFYLGVVHYYDFIGDFKGFGKVVEDKDYCFALFFKTQYKVIKFALAFDIKISCWLVKTYSVTVLGEKHGKEYALPYAARERVNVLGGVLAYVSKFHGFINDIYVFLTLFAGKSKVRKPAVFNKGFDGQCRDYMPYLWEVCNVACPFFGRHR